MTGVSVLYPRNLLPAPVERMPTRIPSRMRHRLRALFSRMFRWGLLVALVGMVAFSVSMSVPEGPHLLPMLTAFGVLLLGALLVAVAHQAGALLDRDMYVPGTFLFFRSRQPAPLFLCEELYTSAARFLRRSLTPEQEEIAWALWPDHEGTLSDLRTTAVLLGSTH